MSEQKWTGYCDHSGEACECGMEIIAALRAALSQAAATGPRCPLCGEDVLRSKTCGVTHQMLAQSLLAQPAATGEGPPDPDPSVPRLTPCETCAGTGWLEYGKDALRRALAEHAEPGKRSEYDRGHRLGDRSGQRKGFAAGVEAAVRRFYEGAAESHVAASVQSFLAALSQPAATGEQP